MGKKDHGIFKLKKVTHIKDIVDGKVDSIPESDICFQDGSHIVQFEYQENEPEKYKIKPGVYTMQAGNGNVTLNSIKLKKQDLLEDVLNTTTIINEATLFFSQLAIYDKLKKAKKRSILIHSAPGMGKSSSINKFCQDSVKEDKGTVVIVWPTSDVDANEATKFFNVQSQYEKNCTRLILVMEDIGSGYVHDYHDNRSVSSSMLNLLDGFSVSFQLPTFIVATTNHPEQLVKELADRPGRFDLVMPLSPPSDSDRVRLMEYIAKRKLSKEEKEVVSSKDLAGFSIAHLEECIIRSLLHNKSLIQVIKEIQDYKKEFSNHFEKKSKLGFSDG